MTNTQEVSQEQQSVEPQEPPAKALPIESRFLFVDVAALRAKQLRRGARVRLAGAPDGAPAPDTPRKPERVAMEEVRQGLVSYELVEPPPASSEGEEPQQ